MKRKSVNFTWENEEAQKVFAEWVPFPNDEDSAKDLDKIERLVSLNPSLFILDVGCGNGRHAIEFVKRGHKVVGIDVAKYFLDQAMKNAKKANVDIEFRLQRASELTEKNTFDLALAYWHTIGFMSDDEIKRHFSAICAALRPNGIFLYTFQGPKLIPGQESSTSTPVKNWSEKNGKFILSEKSRKDGYRDEYCIVIDTVTNEITEYKEHQRAISYEEVIDYLKFAGFSSVTGYKNFNGDPAASDDFNIFLCKK